jgi:hypothetical protein
MYKKIKSVTDGKGITVGSIVAMYSGEEANANNTINRATAEHYEIARYDEETGKYDVSTPSDEISDIPIYIDGKPVTGIMHNEPACYRSIDEFVEDNCWWLLIQD